jgi:hypothetical protein
MSMVAMEHCISFAHCRRIMHDGENELFFIGELLEFYLPKPVS